MNDYLNESTLDDINRGAQLMERAGGGFASALAAAYIRADLGNRARILDAFPELFERYTREAQAERERQLVVQRLRRAPVPGLLPGN